MAKDNSHGEAESGEISTHLCPRYEKAIEILGKPWTGLVIAALMGGPRRFNELLKICDPVSDRLLTERLRELGDEGIVLRTVYPESPVRIEYSLTEKGQAMRDLYNSIQRWAEDWIPAESLQPKTPRKPRSVRKPEQLAS